MGAPEMDAVQRLPVVLLAKANDNREEFASIVRIGVRPPV